METWNVQQHTTPLSTVPLLPYFFSQTFHRNSMKKPVLQNRTARTGQPEQESQKSTTRTEQPGLGKPEQDKASPLSMYPTNQPSNLVRCILYTSAVLYLCSFTTFSKVNFEKQIFCQGWIQKRPSHQAKYPYWQSKDPTVASSLKQ